MRVWGGGRCGGLGMRGFEGGEKLAVYVDNIIGLFLN